MQLKFFAMSINNNNLGGVNNSFYKYFYFKGYFKMLYDNFKNIKLKEEVLN